MRTGPESDASHGDSVGHLTPPKAFAGALPRALPAVVLVAVLVGLASVLTATTVAAAPPTYTVTTEHRMVAGTPQADGQPVGLDTMTYRTSAPDAPAVLLAHGFGGSYADLAPMADQLARGGYDVVTWSARGFGRSDGVITLDDPRYEVADVSLMIDVAAAMPNIRAVGGDPVVAVAGVSYGGALSLMAAAADPRVDAVVPIATWNDLATSFFPNAVLAEDRGPTPAGRLASDASDGGTPGPFKQLWASQFFGSVQAGATGAGVCGRMERSICEMFLDASQTGRPSAAMLAMLRAHSPRPTLDKVTAPALVVQGVSDSLFGLDQADDTARALARAGTPVTVRWSAAGHDSGGLGAGPAGSNGDSSATSNTTGSSDSAGSDATGGNETLTDLTTEVQTWLDHQLRPELDVPAPPGFTYPEPSATFGGRIRELSLPAYPGLAGDGVGLERLPLRPKPSGDPVMIASPPGGLPASVTAVPDGLRLPSGFGVSGYPLAALPGQSWAVDTAPLDQRIDVVGSPSVRLTVSGVQTDTVLFVSLWQVTGTDDEGRLSQSADLPRSLVAPVRITATSGQPQTVEVALPPSSYVFAAGTTWRVLVSTTDSGYAGPRDARLYRVEPESVQLMRPTVPGATVVRTPGTADRPWQDRESLVLAAALLVVILGAIGWSVWWRRSNRVVPALTASPEQTADQTPAHAPDADLPLRVTGLTKTYRDGHRAVDDVSLRAERGQVVGLLGPNRAGKTTTMRMLMGLIRPASGAIEVLGEPIRPGAWVLSRVGALVEGPGFLPHLTGSQNLAAYWAATGRPVEEAHLDEVLEVAALGDAIGKPVRSYSQGMRQRLGIAQAMLGLPELLILDEPTNGLDPPQIAAMRPILREYARGGRTVLISSHLLAEVELTCTHVVVMNAGRVITSGSVSELLASDDTTQLELGPGGVAGPVAAALRGLDGITEVRELDERTIIVHADLPRGQVVAAAVAAGAPLEAVSAHRHLEEVFLGVIADTSASPDDDAAEGSLVDRLRKVRPR